MSVIEVIQADITKLQVDAIVNAANNALMGGGGVDWAIHRAAGPELLDACRALKGCETGKAKITKGFNLPALYIIHAAGPVWNNGCENEEQLLASCYTESLKLAMQYGIKTIAFPAISTGAYRFPFDKALTVAVRTIAEFIQYNDSLTKIYLVFFSNKEFENAQRLYKKITA
ncbi:MAG: O-acetyl-ADP-ribose deacetylase [Bacteroidetes bacterium]|nr:O-acetyl-ADP-ribose deacetylase [Bacteroidota bacterium]